MFLLKLGKMCWFGLLLLLLLSVQGAFGHARVDPQKEKKENNENKKENDQREPIKVTLFLTIKFQGYPVNGAEVIVTPERGSARKAPSNQNGKVELSGIAPGRATIQIVAKGYKTYANVFMLNNPQESYEIGLEKEKEP